MLKFGEEPYLECSSRGDKRFSAYYAKLEGDPGIVKSIEEWYQSFKIFEDGNPKTNWKDAKGKKPINVDECKELYSYLWDLYFKRNPELIEIIKQYKGFTDIFGQEDHCCQAEEIYRIWLTLTH